MCNVQILWFAQMSRKIINSNIKRIWPWYIRPIFLLWRWILGLPLSPILWNQLTIVGLYNDYQAHSLDPLIIYSSNSFLVIFHHILSLSVATQAKLYEDLTLTIFACSIVWLIDCTNLYMNLRPVLIGKFSRLIETV